MNCDAKQLLMIKKLYGISIYTGSIIEHLILPL